MFQDSPYKNSDPGPGIGAGFGTGVLVYIVSLILAIFIVPFEMPHAGFRADTSANLISHLVIFGGLIWGSLAKNRKSFAQGLIICAALGF
jgi:hypothetical protein